MKKPAFLLLLFFSFAGCFGFPIPEQTLKALIEKTPYIIEGKVLSIEIRKYNAEEYISVAKIKIAKTLKGKIRQEAIELFFMPNMICPAPDIYEVDEKILCFIDNKFYSQYGGYNVPGLNYGKRNIDNPDEEAMYTKRITEYLKILKIKNPDKQNIKTTEWLVQCAENEMTRKEAVSDLLKNYDYEKNAKTVQYSELLTPGQRNRLYDCFINTNHDYRHFDFALLNFTKGINDTNILHILKTKANQVTEANVTNCNLYIYYIGMYLKKDFSDISKDLYKNLGTMQYDRKPDHERMAIVYNNFLKMINLEIN